MGVAQLDSPSEGGRAWPLQCCSRRGGLVVSGALASIGGFFAAGALKLTFGNLSLPGPGFFPFALGLLLIALAIAIFVISARRPPEAPRVEFGHAPVLLTFAALVLATFLFERAGALISLGAFSAGMLLFVGHARILPAILSSALGMLAVWYVFKVLLGVQLPLGPLAGML